MGFCIQKVQDKEINYEMWNAQNQKVAFLKSAFVAKLQLWSIPLVGLGYNWGGEWIIIQRMMNMTSIDQLIKSRKGCGAHPVQRITNVSVCRYVDIFWFFSPAVSAVKADNRSPARDGSMMIFKYQCSPALGSLHRNTARQIFRGSSVSAESVGQLTLISTFYPLVHFYTLHWLSLLRQLQSGSKYCSHSR